jgi:hypothetical protein
LCQFLYVVVRRLLEFVVLIGPRDRAKELEILVLRNELSILRRQVGRPRFEAHDRVLRAALSRMLRRDSILRVYIKHYNRALDLKPPDSRIPSPIARISTPHTPQVNRRDLLGGLIHEYELAAA